MRVIIRADSSTAIGSGHLMRCLTLADRLRLDGANIEFVSRELTGNLISLTRQRGYTAKVLPCPLKTEADRIAKTGFAAWLGVGWATDAEQTHRVLDDPEAVDWLIIDHYALDYQWEESLRPKSHKILVIDDLANRTHDCDLLLDQNLYDQLSTRYDRLVPDHCTKLLGPSYALLRPQFAEARKEIRHRNGIVERILVFMGGADGQNVTSLVLKSVIALSRSDIAVDVVVGDANPHFDEVQTQCQLLPNCRIHRQVDNMATLMASADLAIGAGGSTTWERCCLGLPTLFIATAEHEREIARVSGQAGIGQYLGIHSDLGVAGISNALQKLLDDPAKVSELSTNAAAMVDGTGVDRVVERIHSLSAAELTK